MLSLKEITQGAKSAVSNIVKDTKAVFAEILIGVSLMITGLATLFVGNYIIYSIITSLPGLNSASYNTTLASLQSYTNTIVPIFALCFLVAGFSLILYTLRATGQQQSR